MEEENEEKQHINYYQTSLPFFFSLSVGGIIVIFFPSFIEI